MFVLRRLVALLLAFLVFQVNWQASGVACLAEHGAMSGPSHASAMAMASPVTAPGHQDPDPSGPVPPMPSDCPASSMPAGCAAMTACAVGAVLATAAEPIATSARESGADIAEPDARPLTWGSAPDVPPPRA